MFYILFNSREDLEKFCLKELIVVECPSKCSKACFEGYKVYKLRDLKSDIEIVVRKLDSDILSIFPCDAYDGFGFIIGSRISELIRQYYPELINYIINIVKRYSIDFLSITSLPLELDPRHSIYSYSCSEFLSLIYAFYIKDVSEKFLHSIVSRSYFANTLMYTLFTYFLRDFSMILNTYIPWSISYIVHMLSINFESICRKTLKNISSERDLLCLLHVDI